MLNYFIWLLVASMYAPVFYKLYNMSWESVDYTHAYFVLPISLWLTWRKRNQLKELYQNINMQGKVNYLGLIAIFFGVLMFVFGWRQGYLFILSLSLIPLLFGLISYLYGTNITKALLFPLLYLLLLVPPPLGILDSITLPMRHGASYATEKILNLLDYPITREGLELTIGYNKIFMGAPCSGFRSLITMFSLVLVYVYISKGGLSKKLILTSCIVPLALIGNVVRVVTLCLITFYFGEEAGQG
ncbi:MAG: exosortase/archaeosortase family protein, partial [Nitrospirae bacterium]|nr:exosortase/archaeosortase family protein [Nitrospirota bacterium]